METRYTLPLFVCRGADSGVSLCIEVMFPALTLGPFMYPFATGATGEYFPWLRKSFGRPNTGDVSPGKGRQRRYLPSQRALLTTQPPKTCPSGSVSPTKGLGSILGNETRSTSMRPVRSSK